MRLVECDKCGKYFDVEEHEEWGYCPFCENDNVEVGKEEKLMQLYNDLENERDIKIKKMLSKKLDKITIENQKQQIADLEAKLAEKDSAIESWQTMYQSVMKSCHNGIEEDKRLREQLAEKDEEIERLKYTVDFYKSYYISFKEKVIDELEKVKELCRKDMTICEDYFAIAKILDNQIGELTHQHEDKGE
jgi:predicted RNase H-like nuclease (RuvC/YqgF family)